MAQWFGFLEIFSGEFSGEKCLGRFFSCQILKSLHCPIYFLLSTLGVCVSSCFEIALMIVREEFL